LNQEENRRRRVWGSWSDVAQEVGSLGENLNNLPDQHVVILNAVSLYIPSIYTRRQRPDGGAAACGARFSRHGNRRVCRAQERFDRAG